MLDRTSRWDQELNGEDQQSVMLARLLIHRPRWAVLDDVFDAMDGKTRSRAFEIFASDLKDSAIVHIGRADAADPSFTRRVRIVKDPKIRRMVRARLADATSSLPGTHAAAAS